MTSTPSILVFCSDSFDTLVPHYLQMLLTYSQLLYFKTFKLCTICSELDMLIIQQQPLSFLFSAALIFDGTANPVHPNTIGSIDPHCQVGDVVQGKDQ